MVDSLKNVKQNVLFDFTYLFQFHSKFIMLRTATVSNMQLQIYVLSRRIAGNLMNDISSLSIVFLNRQISNLNYLPEFVLKLQSDLCIYRSSSKVCYSNPFHYLLKWPVAIQMQEKKFNKRGISECHTSKSPNRTIKRTLSSGLSFRFMGRMTVNLCLSSLSNPIGISIVTRAVYLI